MAGKSLKGDQFDRAAYQEASSRFISLKSHLPEQAVHALAAEVIQRVAARAGGGAGVQDGVSSLDQVDHLAYALIDGEAEAALDFVTALSARGMPVEEIYLSYLGGAARRLGEWWTDNHVSFLDVTQGTARIYGILRVLDKVQGGPVMHTQKCALFASTPNDTHTLGVRMAADLFRRHGWEIDLVMDLGHAELVARISGAGFRIIGLSAAGQHAVPALARLVMALRINQPDALIFVGGALVNDAPDLVRDLAPDGTATTVPDAFEVMDSLWAQLAKP
ncbi:B12-binding domain-containing protein [Actibacterium sp. 188UL27-1]|uniref:cobalamin B12-binding domain-containing protein n=1 Tax=Actibacterium sp. 188UL27-1 TaxID=2786961 RepID=UPI00195B9404|nr:cobalamin-dependent protein [Actibacterium sp. 188UL27-1]MBM7068056.1 cobalamin-dependent protein [Actibacterium sp. 188UL27-1]